MNLVAKTFLAACCLLSLTVAAELIHVDGGWRLKPGTASDVRPASRTDAVLKTIDQAENLAIMREDRAAFANKYPNAIFVSIHFNKSLGGGASGIETFALAPRGVPSMDEENFSMAPFSKYSRFHQPQQGVLDPLCVSPLGSRCS